MILEGFRNFEGGWTPPNPLPHLGMPLSGIITPVGGRPVHRLREDSCDDTRCCIIQFWPPDDEHIVLGIRRGAAATRLLGLRVRIRPWAWMSVSFECCVVSGRDLCVGLITRPQKWSPVEMWWHTVTHGRGSEGKLANGVGSQYPSHYLGTWCIQHYYRWCAHLGCQ